MTSMGVLRVGASGSEALQGDVDDRSSAPEVIVAGATPKRRGSRVHKSSSTAVARFDPDAPLFLISTAARLAGMHPQTLRTYDRMGLVVPKRTSGKGRRYTMRDIEKLRFVQYLSQDEGINLSGVRHIIELKSEVERLQDKMIALTEEIRVLHRTATTGRVFISSEQEIRLRRG
jgi:MerR family transcriptional regulator/heat shock protein HspR